MYVQINQAGREDVRMDGRILAGLDGDDEAAVHGDELIFHKALRGEKAPGMDTHECLRIKGSGIARAQKKPAAHQPGRLSGALH